MSANYNIVPPSGKLAPQLFFLTGTAESKLSFTAKLVYSFLAYQDRFDSSAGKQAIAMGVGLGKHHYRAIAAALTELIAAGLAEQRAVRSWQWEFQPFIIKDGKRKPVGYPVPKQSSEYEYRAKRPAGETEAWFAARPDKVHEHWSDSIAYFEFNSADNLTALESAVKSLLESHYRRTGMTYTSGRGIARQLGCSNKSASKAINRIAAAKLITVTPGDSELYGKSRRLIVKPVAQNDSLVTKTAIEARPSEAKASPVNPVNPLNCWDDYRQHLYDTGVPKTVCCDCIELLKQLYFEDREQIASRYFVLLGNAIEEHHENLASGKAHCEHHGNLLKWKLKKAADQDAAERERQWQMFDDPDESLTLPKYTLNPTKIHTNPTELHTQPYQNTLLSIGNH